MPEGIAFVQIFDWVKNVSSFLVAIAAIIAFIKPLRMWLIGKVRSWAGYEENCARYKETIALLEAKESRLADSITMLIKRFDETDKRFDKIETQLIGIQQCQNRTEDFEKKRLRSNILNIYRTFREIGKIPEYKEKELVEDFKKYSEDYNGNGYVLEVFQRTRNWQVVDEVPFQK